MQPPGPLLGNPSFCPPLSSSGDSPSGSGYRATWPFCGPPLILSPPLKWSGTPYRNSYVGTRRLWATRDFAPRSEAVGTPKAARLMQPPGPLVDHS